MVIFTILIEKMKLLENVKGNTDEIHRHGFMEGSVFGILFGIFLLYFFCYLHQLIVLVLTGLNWKGYKEIKIINFHQQLMQSSSK